MLQYLVEGGIAGRGSPSNCTAPLTTGIHSPSSSTNCAPPEPKWCRSGFTAGIPHPATGSSTSWWRASRRRSSTRSSFTSAPAVASVLLRAKEMGIEDGGAVGVAHQRACDVRRAGHGPATGAARCADVSARADAVGCAGPAHHRRAAAVAGAHGPAWRGTCWRSAAPACWSTARSRRCRLRRWRRSGRWRMRPGAVVSRTDLLRRCRAAAPIPTPSRRPCCGFVPRWGTRRSCRRWSSGVTDWPSTRKLRTHNEPATRRPRHPKARGVSLIGPGRTGVVGTWSVPCGSRSSTSSARHLPNSSRDCWTGRRCWCRRSWPAAITSPMTSPAHVAASGHGDVIVAQALGPSPANGAGARRSVDRIGWRPDDSVILAAAGTSDPVACATCTPRRVVVGAIRSRVELAFAATGEPRVADAVAALRGRGAKRVVVASYCCPTGCFRTGYETAAPTR